MFYGAMYKAVFTDEHILESTDLRLVYKTAERDRRYAKRYDQGQIGYTLTNPSGEVLLVVKAGKDMTLQEVEPTVRLYNVTMRKLLMDGKIAKGQRDITLGELERLVEAGAMKNARNAGTKTYAELFSILRIYMGWSEEWQAALIECMNGTPTGKDWLRKHGWVA